MSKNTNETRVYVLFDTETGKIWNGQSWSSDLLQAEGDTDLHRFTQTESNKLGSVFFDNQHLHVLLAQDVANQVSKSVNESVER